MTDLANAMQITVELITDAGLLSTIAAVGVLLVMVFGVVLAVRVAKLLADTYTIKVTDDAFRWLLDRIVAVGVLLSRRGSVAVEVANEAFAALDDYARAERSSRIRMIGHAFWYAWKSKEASIERSRVTPPTGGSIDAELPTITGRIDVTVTDTMTTSADVFQPVRIHDPAVRIALRDRDGGRDATPP